MTVVGPFEPYHVGFPQALAVHDAAQTNPVPAAVAIAAPPVPVSLLSKVDVGIL